jgi:hypothetical protein
MHTDSERLSALFELLGRPGAGKSTAMNQLPPSIRKVVLESPCPSRRFRSVGERIRLLFHYPLWAALIYGVALGARGGRIRAFRNSLSVQRRVAALEAIPRDVRCVVDEGVIHGVFVLLYNTRPTRLSVYCFRKVVSWLVDQNVSWIYLDVDIEECIRRFSERQSASSRFSALSSDRVVADFRSSVTYETLLSVLCESFPGRIHVARSQDEVIRLVAT